MTEFRIFLAGLLTGGVAGVVVTTFTIALCMIAGDADERAGYK